MATLPPRFNPNESHNARQLAESFGINAERYDRTRPRYPQALIERIVASSPGGDVLDVGIGTGVSARPFLTAGCSVLGIEPDERMAEFARSSGLEVEVGKFEDWDAAGRRFDTVIAGQAWHWVDPIVGAAKATEVLRPHGRLAVFWNAFEPPPELAVAFSAVYRRVLPDSPFGGGGAPAGRTGYASFLSTAADSMRETGFGAPEEWQVDWERSYSKAEWLDQVPTFGGHSLFPQGKLEELLSGIGEVIDEAGGSFTMKYAAVAVTAARE